MACDNCKSRRILEVNGKTSDLVSFTYDTKDYNSDTKCFSVPQGLNIGGGDYIEFELCMNCGKVQGKFPITEEHLDTAFKIKRDEDE